MLLIYTPHITNRIQYIMQYVFTERLGVEYSVISNKEHFISNTTDFKIVYADKNFTNEIFFYANGLLFNEEINKIELHENVYNGTTILFSHNDNSALSFDVFAAIFYLLSRYEEYLNAPLDEHDNFNFKNSILYTLNVLQMPVVEQWIELLKEVLIKKFPSLKFSDHIAKFCLSIDVDIAYAYKNRNIIRTAGGMVIKIFQLAFNEIKNQLLTLLNKRKDMFDTYNYIFSLIKSKTPVFFFNMGAYGKFDKNPSYKNKKFQQLIKKISDKAIIGLHPSYASNSNKNLITIEKNKLERIIKKSVTASRQHYLKLKLPDTFNTLISNSIDKDFTMGYAYNYGFRAGTCNSFLFFDLKKNQTTNLRLYPFSYMEGSLNYSLKMNIETAKKTISELIDTTHKYKGIFIPLWHNSTLCNCNEWKGWREVFEHTLKETDDKNFENLFN